MSLIDGVAQRQGLPPLGMLEIAPYGLAAVVAGGITLTVFGPRLLPSRGSASAAIEGEDIAFLTEVRIAKPEPATDDSNPVKENFTLDAFSGLRFSRLVAVLRGAERLKPEESLALKAGDRIVLNWHLAYSTEYFWPLNQGSVPAECRVTL